MKILLTASNTCTDPYPVYPLGMSVIAQALAAAGHDVKQFDVAVSGLGALPEAIRSFSPEAVGISIRNLDSVNSRTPGQDFLRMPVAMAEVIRGQTDAPLILGGSGFSLLPEEILKLTGADYGVIGEGESAMTELIAILARGGKPESCLIRGCGGVQCGALYQQDIRDYYCRLTHILPVQTKRGCPFHCVYCTYPALEGCSMRLRDPAEVAGQLEKLAAELPDVMFYFVDAVFNDPAREYHRLLKEMERRSLTVPFAAFLTPGGLNAEDLDLLCSRGMIAAELGIDGAADETLRGLGKNFDFGTAARVCRELLARNVGVTANVMFGGPDETWETVRRGIGNLRSIEPVHTLVFSGIRILPHTPLFALAKKENVVPPDWNGRDEIYYYAPGIEPERLHRELCEGFAASSCCIYPPHACNDSLKTLHRFGYANYRKLTGKGAE